MKRLNNMKMKLTPIAAAMALSLASGSAFALQNYYIAAKPYTKMMPDGSSVPMWGYVADPSGTCYNQGSNAARLTCIGNLGTPTMPGPSLEVPVNEVNIQILLSNGLPEPTSLIIPGQEIPFSATAGGPNGPTWNDGTVGPRTNANQRVRSFGLEAPANGGRRQYIWNTNRATIFTGTGTFMYTSGTHPQKQVYMGLAGLVTKDTPAGEAYPGVSYDNEVTLFYSDIDPAFNAAVAAGTLTTAIDRHPTWYLVNGAPYQTGLGDITTGTNGPLTAGQTTLLRLASTATDTHVAVMQGMDMTIHAEDGQQYNYQDGSGNPVAATPRKQYSAMLPPAKTKDATIVAPDSGRYAVYDGNGYMTNPSDPANETVGDTVGGMLRFLSFNAGSNGAPIAVNDAASVVSGFTANIGVLSNDSDPEGDPITIAGFVGPGHVNCMTGIPGGTCSYDATGIPDGMVEMFTYTISDGTSTSAPATVTVTVTANQPPMANADAAATDQNVAVAINVIANDTDPEGQPLSVGSFDAVSTGGQAVSCAGTSCTYTPSGGYTGTDTFTYTATDGVNPSNSATVTVTVTAPNLAPTANDDPSETTGINTQLTGIDVLANDTDPEGDPLSIATFDASSTQGGTVGCVTGVTGGTCTYTPPTGFIGTDTFTYTATDGVNNSGSATVTVEVTGAGVPALYFSTIGAGAVPGVSGPNDDGDIYTVDSGNVFSRLYDAVTDLGLPNNANIDGMSVNGTTIYLSFAAANTNVPTLGGVPDEDVVAYNTTTGTWSTYFDGSLCGLDASNGRDIDALSVSGGTLYFSTRGGGNGNSVTGVSAPYDDADVYTWSGGASCGRALDGSATGLPGNADIDGLTVQGGTYYISFDRNAGTNVPGIGVVQDESVVTYNGANWAMFRTNTGLSSTDSQDVDAIHVP